MPRLARIVFAGIPHHITQRGNRRADVFFDDADRTSYLKEETGSDTISPLLERSYAKRLLCGFFVPVAAFNAARKAR